MDNHLAGIAITPKQLATHEMRQEALSSAGAQDMYTKGDELSYLDSTEFFCDNPYLEIDDVFRPRIDTLSP